MKKIKTARLKSFIYNGFVFIASCFLSLSVYGGVELIPAFNFNINLHPLLSEFQGTLDSNIQIKDFTLKYDRTCQFGGENKLRLNLKYNGAPKILKFNGRSFYLNSTDKFGVYVDISSTKDCSSILANNEANRYFSFEDIDTMYFQFTNLENRKNNLDLEVDFKKRTLKLGTDLSNFGGQGKGGVSISGKLD